MATWARAGPVDSQIHVMLDSRESMDRPLTSRASIRVAFRYVDKVGLRKQTFFPGRRRERLGNIRADVIQIACPYLRPAEVTAVRNNLQLRSAHRVLRRYRHSAELSMIVADIGYFVFNDQMMFRINCCLDVVAHYAGASSTRCHRARVRIRHRQLPVRLLYQLPADLVELTHLLAQHGDLLVESDGGLRFRSDRDIAARFPRSASGACRSCLPCSSCRGCLMP